jgi:hypothetical protein
VFPYHAYSNISKKCENRTGTLQQNLQNGTDADVSEGNFHHHHHHPYHHYHPHHTDTQTHMSL